MQVIDLSDSENDEEFFKRMCIDLYGEYNDENMAKMNVDLDLYDAQAQAYKRAEQKKLNKRKKQRRARCK